ncbi:MAG: hypothetical protein J4N75_08550 [Chloroflexi bacterium]|nr:hypothetical protein [Chloroflexota bacterium]
MNQADYQVFQRQLTGFFNLIKKSALRYHQETRVTLTTGSGQPDESDGLPEIRPT